MHLGRSPDPAWALTLLSLLISALLFYEMADMVNVTPDSAIGLGGTKRYSPHENTLQTVKGCTHTPYL